MSLFFGWLTGLLMNRAKGREMITGMILGFFANGIYQFMFLLMAGPVLPLHGTNVSCLPTGVGLRNTIDLVGTKHQSRRADPSRESRSWGSSCSSPWPPWW